MSEDRSRILNMLAEGKITAEEAERLLDALDARAGAAGSVGRAGDQGRPRTPARGAAEVPLRQGRSPRTATTWT